MIRLLSGTLNLLFAFFLGALLIVIFALYFPEYLEVIQIKASQFKEVVLQQITSLGSKPSVTIWLRFLFSDEQFVFLFFVILARVLLALCVYPIHRIFRLSRNDNPKFV